MKKTQMTESTPLNSGASSTPLTHWEKINWFHVSKSVYRLQMRIAKAAKQGKYQKVRALQRLLTRSYHAKLLAVKRVTSNRGARTSGVDKQLWSTNKAKERAVNHLKHSAYQVQPLKRIYIPKKKGQKRPLSIPTMKDRAMQALHLLSLEPVAEVQADLNSYGFRPKRSTADAIEQCFKVLAQKQSATWILEADIQSCFDKISHTWMQKHIPMDKKILTKWLKAGYVDQGVYAQTNEGVPQGGIISPTLMNMTLNGLESCAKGAAPKRHKIHVIRYADDFIVTADCKEVLEETVKPAIDVFLKERGLNLSEEKTHITVLSEGFDFLGCTLRKFKGTLKIKPSKANIKRFLEEIRGMVKRFPSVTTSMLINQLNPKIRGWRNYYRHLYAQGVFSYVDHQLYQALSRWIKRRHPNKSTNWTRKKYFTSFGHDNWRFYTTVKNAKGKSIKLYLVKMTDTKTAKHIKIKAHMHPYVGDSKSYFDNREKLFSYLPKSAGEPHSLISA